MRKLLESLFNLLTEMGKTFRRNSEDSYKYGGNKRPKPKPRRQPPRVKGDKGSSSEDWRNTFQEVEKVLRDDDGRKPNEQ